jgi:hypothetical protein
MAHWQDRFLGIGELPPQLSIFEIEYFQFSAPDIAAIRKEFRPKYRIAVALQLGFMRLTGARLNAFNGAVSAVHVLERFGSAAQGDPIYRAAKMLGRLLRTIYLCDYFTKPVFRREIHRVLNRGESVHTLQRAIHSGEIPHDRGRRPEEMHAISGSLALLTNLVIGWTSLRTEAALAVLKSRGVVLPAEVLRHVSPIRYHNINFRGTFRFPFEKYLVALLGDEASRTGMVVHG